jgi:carboxyl-terminal processing protease
VVTRSDLPQLHVGDAIVEIDGEAIEGFFQKAHEYISDSSERSERTELFRTTYLFPAQFVLSLSDHHKVRIVRTQQVDPAQPPEQVAGHWLVTGQIAYIRIPSFSGVVSESAAITLVRQFKDAHGLVIDLRGNPGGYGNSPLELQSALMERPFRSWRESLGRFSSARGNRFELTSGADNWAKPEHGIESGIYRGRLVILIDSSCASYCEDFVMPFKDSHRAMLVGEATAGSYAQTYFLVFDDGMVLNTAATRETFPDGSRFEGVGIVPDVEASPTLEDIRSRKDVVLARAVEILGAHHD